jgi:hypothetical protein
VQSGLATGWSETINRVSSLQKSELTIMVMLITVPRRSSRFFQVLLLCRLPGLADHPIYFGLANFI